MPRLVARQSALGFSVPNIKRVLLLSVSAAERTVTSEASQFGSSTTPPGKLKSRVDKGWHGSKPAKLGKLEKIDLPGARAGGPRISCVSSSTVDIITRSSL